MTTKKEVGAVLHTQSPAQLRYMVQLDALRALAVFGVMSSHLYHGRYAQLFPLGVWGVQLFFVLSGFLITGILLKCRDLKNESNSTIHLLKQFYIRRSLRIFPLFYLVIIMTALVNIQPVRETIFWHLTYTSNIYFALRGSWNGCVSHLWTLAVEEQFYLVWPCLILFIRSKYLVPCIVTAILLSPLYQVIGVLLRINSIALSVITIANLQYLGMGALLAYFRDNRPAQYKELGQRPTYNGSGPILLLIMMALSLTGSNRFFIGLLSGFVAVLFFTWLIHKTSLGFGGVVGKLFETELLLFFGKISYGLYIYHNFMPYIVPSIFRRLHISWPESSLIQFLVYLVVTIVTATLSWFLFERPINDMKSRFKYSQA